MTVLGTSHAPADVIAREDRSWMFPPARLPLVLGRHALRFMFLLGAWLVLFWTVLFIAIIAVGRPLIQSAEDPQSVGIYVAFGQFHGHQAVCAIPCETDLVFWL